MARSDEAEFREYASGQMEPLRRTAYLLCRDWHTADDLVSVTLTKLFRRWSVARSAGNLDAYVRKMLLNAWLDERRRPWRREEAVERVPDTAAAGAPDVEGRADLLSMLAELTPRRRAAVVLRYYCDLSVEETAEVLRCSPGTVKSLTFRGLDALRTHLAGNTAV